MRVLIFGSRTWDDMESTFNRLRQLKKLADMLNEPLTLVEGCCPMGADLHAEAWVMAYHDPGGRNFIEHHPPLRPYSGALKQRNVEMAQSRPDFAIGFFRGETPGSMHMLDQLLLRGVPVYRVNWEER